VNAHRQALTAPFETAYRHRVARRLLQVLDEAGIRLTAPRRMVADVLDGRTDTFTASQVLAETRARQPGIGRATVFRTLDLLLDVGAIERIALPEAESGYLVCDPDAHHHHVVCRRCGRSTDIDDRGVRALAKKISKRSGYRIDTHRLELYGLCPSCQKATA
jgi:Fur family transcriptional regulator, ferric uptake regulator